MLNIIYNCPNIELGEELKAFKDYTLELTPPLKGLAFANFEYLKKIHNSFARFVISDVLSGADKNLFWEEGLAY